MDGRSGDGSADSDEHRPAAGSGDDSSGTAETTGSSTTEKTGWPYEPDVSIGDGQSADATAASSLEETSDPEVASVFWRVVLLVDVALLCLTIGPLLYVVRNSPVRGAGLVALGIVALGYAYHLYRDFRDDDDDGSGAAEDRAEDGVADAERNG